MDELPLVRFKFPFILIGKSTVAFLKGQSWHVLKSWYTSVGPEQGFRRCFADEHNRSLVLPVAQAYHRTMHDYASIDEVLSELELRFSGNDQEILCSLGNFCHSETPVKESLSFPALLNCTKSTARFSKPSRQHTRGFVVCTD